MPQYIPPSPSASRGRPCGLSGQAIGYYHTSAHHQHGDVVLPPSSFGSHGRLPNVSPAGDHGDSQAPILRACGSFVPPEAKLARGKYMQDSSVDVTQYVESTFQRPFVELYDSLPLAP